MKIKPSKKIIADIRLTKICKVFQDQQRVDIVELAKDFGEEQRYPVSF